ncbi:TetR/AcrR family transcriptional regulator [Cellulomonas rhizosphaerae]|uniref:TetR/AcrR family transcriptional regulator n=1 Tax=Cellulomonas rhizosphaerae TaxID=2293719 RepID=A0A413RMG4_9CELL|nr:TetR/AcrR family transcriptional regulator [Cellulomonas rhizosphaerae]RHA41664.1 TetR/AcrR family transcriptional regulator [Cellulomonas rhizosphaerae]
MISNAKSDAPAAQSDLQQLADALTPAPDGGLRERKKRARREALIDATHRLVEEHGLDAVTVEAICAEAGVSTRTFFNYFETKDDAVLGHVPWPLDTEAAVAFAAGGPSGHLLSDLETLVGSFLQDPPVGRERFNRAFEIAAREPRLLARHLAWFEQHKGQIVALVEQRLGEEPERSPLVVAALALFLTHATFMHWDESGGAGDGGDHLAFVVAELRALVTD